MKKLILLVLAGVFSLQMNAQQVVKLAPLKLINGKLAVGYEKVVNEKFTLGVGLQVVFPNNFENFNEGIQDAVIEANGTDISTQLSNSFGGFSRDLGIKITPEARYYFSGNAPRGVYGLGYLRFTRSQWSWESQYVAAPNNDVVNFELKSPLTVLGAGLGLGVQSFLGEKFTIDWNIGLGGGFYSFGLRGEVSAQNPEAINSFFNDIETTFETEFLDNVNSTSVSQSFGRGGFPGLLLISRLTLGYYIQ